MQKQITLKECTYSATAPKTSRQWALHLFTHTHKPTHSWQSCLSGHIIVYLATWEQASTRTDSKSLVNSGPFFLLFWMTSLARYRKVSFLVHLARWHMESSLFKTQLLSYSTHASTESQSVRANRSMQYPIHYLHLQWNIQARQHDPFLCLWITVNSLWGFALHLFTY